MRTIRYFLLTVVLYTLLGLPVYGQIEKPVTWEFSTERDDQGAISLVFEANIDKGWTVYSQFLAEDASPVPTMIEYETLSGVELIGKSIETGNKKEGMDPIFEEHVIKFLADKPYRIVQQVQSTEANAKVSGYLTFMTCNNEKCLPPTDVDFSFDLTESASTVANQIKTKEVLEEDVQNVSIESAAQEIENKNISSVDNQNATSQTIKNAPVKIPEQATPTQQIKNNTKTKTDDKVGLDEPKKVNPKVDFGGQIPNLDQPVVWHKHISKINENEYEATLTAKLLEGWQIYSYYTDEGGPLPTVLEFDNMEAVQKLNEPIESGYKKEGNDPLFFGMNVIKFLSKEHYTFKQKISTTLDRASGYLSYMSCNDEKCIPFDEDIIFDLKNNKILASSEAHEEIMIDAISGEFIDQKRDKIVETYAAPLSNCGGEARKNNSIIWMFIFGFGGGLLALLTPCVFPMIPLTVSFFTKDTKRKGWTNALIYGASIIVIYVALGLILTAVFGEEALNRLSTNWIANTLFFLIFLLFAFSFFGFYEITLPSSWSTKSDQMADKGGLIGIFFMAFTLALVSFSCTGPIIGTAIVQAATNQVGPAVVMLGFSMALAIPFTLFAAFPMWLNSLPKSGGWMNSVKVILGFLELALAFKFLSVADMTNNWGLLKYEIFLGIWLLVAIGMTLYLFGYIKFPHDSPIKKLSKKRMGFAVGALLLTLYLGTGFLKNEATGNYNTLKMFSGITPPAHYNFFLTPPPLDPDIKAKYPSFSKCANNIDCFKDYYEGLAYSKETGKPMLVDMTGYGCVNCRKTEEHIWIDDQILDHLKNDFVMVALYVDDDKKLEETLISKSRNKKIRNVGNKWADFQIVNFQQNSQPLYIMMTPEEDVIAKPRGYQEGVKSYRDYLNCGLQHFSGLKDLGAR